MQRPSLAWVRLLVVAALVVPGLMTPRVAAAAGTAEKPLGADKSAAELLPGSTLVYAEIAKPRELIGLVLDNPAVSAVLGSPEYQAALNGAQFKEAFAHVAALEQRAGVKWRQALEASTGGGIVIAMEPTTQGGVLLMRADDAKTVAAVRDALIGMARDDAKAKGQPDPIQQTKYRELTAYRSGENRLVEMGPWLLSTNKPKLGQMVVDAYLDGPAEGMALAQTEDFIAARALSAAAGANPTPAGWAFARLPALRLLALGQPWMSPDYKNDNPGAEMLVGGLLGVAQKTPYVTLSLDASKDGLKVSVAAPNDPSWVSPERQFYFAPAGEGGKLTGGAAKPLRPKGTVLSLTTYRDFAAMWQAGPDLFTEGVATQMAQTDTGLSNLLGGKSFGTDVLGAFKPQFQFIVAAQDYKAAGVVTPGIQIPAFAAVIRLKPAEAQSAALKKHLRVGFQSAIVLGNLDGAAKNRPMFEMQTEKRGPAEINYAVYEKPEEEAPAGAAAAPATPAGEGEAQVAAAKGQAPADAASGAKADAAADAKTDAAAQPAAAPTAAAATPKTRDDIHYNFSPALVVAPDYLMMCSTKDLAIELVDLANADAAAGKGEATIAENTLLEVDAATIARLLRDNREQLVANNMLEKGHGHDAAAKETDFLVGLVNYFQSASLRLTPTEKTISLDMEIKTTAGK